MDSKWLLVEVCPCSLIELKRWCYIPEMYWFESSQGYLEAKMNVSTVLNERGKDYDDRAKIKDMGVWQTGYTVPWAYNKHTRTLDRNFPIWRYSGGTVTLFVVCIGTDMYVVDFDRDGRRRKNRCPSCQRYLFDD
jgi:hypothetical protein